MLCPIWGLKVMDRERRLSSAAVEIAADPDLSADELDDASDEDVGVFIFPDDEDGDANSLSSKSSDTAGEIAFGFGEVRQLRHHFCTISHAFLSSNPPHIIRAVSLLPMLIGSAARCIGIRCCDQFGASGHVGRIDGRRRRRAHRPAS